MMLSGIVFAQDVATAEQLLDRGRDESGALAVSLYITGWRDGASRELIAAAEDLRESGGDVGDYPDHQEALGRCLQRLEVADLYARLDQMRQAGDNVPQQSSAPAALMNAATELCRAAIATALAEPPRR